MHPANEAQVNKLPEVIDAMAQANGIAPEGACWLIKATPAKPTGRQEQGHGRLIQHKAVKGKPLYPMLKKLNTAIGGPEAQSKAGVWDDEVQTPSG